MCDCFEIQTDHGWKSGDWFHAECTTWVIGDAGFIYETRDGSHKRSDIPIPSKAASECGWGCEEKLTWLPRQDQLQEIVWDVNLIGQFIDFNLICIMADFNHFVHMHSYIKDKTEALEWIKYISIFGTYEQLWLAFVMYEKHNKMWNGKKWMFLVSVKKNGLNVLII